MVSAASANDVLARDQGLAELGRVWWRPRVDERSLNRAARRWTLATATQSLPFLAAAVVLALNPVTLPLALVALVHAVAIPELHAARGANVVRRRAASDGVPEQVALGLLGDLVTSEARDLHIRTQLVLERGTLGVWLVGAAGALLLRPGGRRVHCYCVRVPDGDLPASDRLAHLLLALRTDEIGFTTLANLAFAGAPSRLRRRLPARMREALDRAVGSARSMCDPAARPIRS